MELRSYGVFLFFSYVLNNQRLTTLTKLWDFLEGKTLFQAVDPHKVEEYDDEKHLAYITALLGPAPKDLLNGGKRTSMFYGPDGKHLPSLDCKKDTAA